MVTTCTNCHARFRLNVAQLTAAQGQVRCGKCGEVFDAYEVLEGAEVAPQMPAPAAPGPEAPGPLPTAEAGPAAPDANLHTADEAAPSERRPPTPDEAAETGITVEQDAEQKADLPLITAEDEPITTAPALRASRKARLPIDDLFKDLPDVPETGSEAAAPFIGSEPDAVEPIGELEGIAEEPAPNSYAHVDVLHAPPAPKPRRPWVSAGQWTLIVLLAVALAAQFIDLDRAALSQNPVLGPSLQALYSALGHPIDKPLSVSDWNVGSLNVTTDPDSGGALSITGTLANQAGFVQPWPYLRVVLTDRFGETLRSRDFKPADYLAAGQAASLLPPGLAARFRLDIVDPGPDAVGFSLTPCLDAASGRVCAVANASD